MVTGVTQEQARRILTDFWAALVEISRRTAKDARIELKEFGFVTLLRNRELQFFYSGSNSNGE